MGVAVTSSELWLLWEKGRLGGLLVISPTKTRCLLPSQSKPHPSNLCVVVCVVVVVCLFVCVRESQLVDVL